MDDSTQFEVTAPVVVNRRKKKKRKKRYSRDLKDIQIMERHLTRASHRMVKAGDEGLATYRKTRNKSARKRRDGAIIYFLPNVAKGMSKTLRVASPVPYDLVRASYTKTTRRMFRRQIRFAGRLSRDWLR